jgi:hypothetical protein
MSILSQFKQSQNTDFPNVRPSLDLRFALAKKLDPRITFTRGSTGTYFGPDGIMRTAGVNEPRFDHDPITGQSLGLLIEESRSNLLVNSDDFNSWTKNNYNVSTNVITAPDGTLTADKIIPTNLNIYHDIFKTPSLSSNTYTLSIFAKAAEQSFIRLRIDDGTLTRVAMFNLATGSVSSSVNVTSSTITPYPNGWYRCSITVTTNIINVVFNSFPTSSTANYYTGDGTSGIYVWGAQLEAGAFPTSYIPTTASTVTRSADNASMTGTNFSSWYNQSEGTVLSSVNFIENLSSSNFASNNILYGINDNSTNNRITLFGLNGFKSIVSRYVISGFTYPSSTVVISSRKNKFAHSFKTTGVSLVGNGGTPSATQTVTNTYPTVNRLEIGNQIGTFYLNGTISRLTYYPIQLTNQQLINLTS